MQMDSQTFTLKSNNTEAEQDLSDPAGRGSKQAGSEVGKENRPGQEGTEGIGSGSHNLPRVKLELPISESDRKTTILWCSGRDFQRTALRF